MFPHHGGFPKLNFKQVSGGWWDAEQVYPEAIADIPYNQQREPLKLGGKDIFGRL